MKNLGFVPILSAMNVALLVLLWLVIGALATGALVGLAALVLHVAGRRPLVFGLSAVGAIPRGAITFTLLLLAAVSVYGAIRTSNIGLGFVAAALVVLAGQT